MSITPQEGSPRALAAFGIERGPRAGEELAVRSPVVTIGQGAASDLVIDDDSVSRAHARLEFEGGAWRLTDLDSINGTYLDGTRLAPQVPTPLQAGAEVRFGAVATRFQPVDSADVEAARASYVPPAAPVPVAQRSRGIRFPLWAFVLLLLIVGAVIFFVVRRPVPEPAPAPSTTTAVSALLPAPDHPGRA